MRVLAGVVVLVVVALAAVHAFQAPIGYMLAERAIAERLAVNTLDDLGEGLHAGLCGSGSPFPDESRAGPCLFVIAGEQFFVVDTGGGSTETLQLMGLPVGEIDALFLTHYHSDHIADLGELMLQRWAGASNQAPLPVYGPRGLGEVISGFNAALALDASYRVAHHGPETMPPGGAGSAVVWEVETLSNDGTRIVYDEGGLLVTMFLVDHHPVDPTVGYRFDYGGRSVVISGDTSYSPQVVAQAQNADLLFHDALSTPLVTLIEEEALARDDQAIAHIMTDIMDYHATPEEAARTAQEAGVDMLVLYHLVPPIPSRFFYPAFLGEADGYFEGPIIVGEDRMLFSLPTEEHDVIERSQL